MGFVAIYREPGNWCDSSNDGVLNALFRPLHRLTNSRSTNTADSGIRIILLPKVCIVSCPNSGRSLSTRLSTTKTCTTRRAQAGEAAQAILCHKNSNNTLRLAELEALWSGVGCLAADDYTTTTAAAAGSSSDKEEVEAGDHIYSTMVRRVGTKCFELGNNSRVNNVTWSYLGTQSFRQTTKVRNQVPTIINWASPFFSEGEAGQMCNLLQLGLRLPLSLPLYLRRKLVAPLLVIIT